MRPGSLSLVTPKELSNLEGSYGSARGSPVRYRSVTPARFNIANSV